MMIRYRIKPGKQGLYYVGAPPTGTGYFLSCTLGQLTEQELAAWVATDPATALKYIEQTTISSEPEKPTNHPQPGAGGSAQGQPGRGKKKKG